MKENFDGLLDYLNEAIGIKSGINSTGVESAVNNIARPHNPVAGENKTGRAGAFNPEEGGHTPEEIAKKHGKTVEEVNRKIVIGVRVEISKGQTDKTRARKTVTDRLFNDINAYGDVNSAEHKEDDKTPAGAPHGAVNKMHESVLNRCIELVRERKQPIQESAIYEQFVYIKEAQLKDVITPDTNGRAYTVIFKFNGKPMIQNLFWPDARRPSRQDMTKYLHLLYPGAILTTFQRFEGGDPYGHGVLLVNKASIKPELRK